MVCRKSFVKDRVFFQRGIRICVLEWRHMLWIFSDQQNTVNLRLLTFCRFCSFDQYAAKDQTICCFGASIYHVIYQAHIKGITNDRLEQHRKTKLIDIRITMEAK